MAVEHTDGLPGHVVDDLLDSPRRRRLLCTLKRCDEAVCLTTLAAELVAAERGVPPEEVAVEERRATEAALREEDLPKLLATDVVAYDSTLDALSLSKGAAQIEPRLPEREL